MKELSELIRDREIVKEERKAVAYRLRVLEETIAAKAADKAGWKIGDKITLKKCDKIITAIKFYDRSPYYVLFGARIKKNGEHFQESREIFSWERT